MIFAAFVLFFSLPLHAQSRMPPAGATPSASNNSGGGGGGGSYGGGGGAGIHSLPSCPARQYSYSYAHGSGADFAPTSFLPYDQAVKLGDAVLAEKPKSLGEVAAEYRAAKKQSHEQSLRSGSSL
jgi:hypothetical protein